MMWLAELEKVAKVLFGEQAIAAETAAFEEEQAEAEAAAKEAERLEAER